MAKVNRAAAVWRTYQEVSQPGTPGLMKRIGAIPRMVRAGMRGDYPGMGKGKIGLMALGIVYLISPIDAIPEFLLIIGVADDFGVLLWLAGSLVGESGRYLGWERKVITGTTVPPA